MTFFDDKPSDLPEQESSLPPAAEPLPAEDPNFRLAGDPISYAAALPLPTLLGHSAGDLRISVLSISSFFISSLSPVLSHTDGFDSVLRAASQHVPKDLERYLLNKPSFSFWHQYPLVRRIFLFLT